MATDITASSLGYSFKSELETCKLPVAEADTWPTFSGKWRSGSLYGDNWQRYVQTVSQPFVCQVRFRVSAGKPTKHRHDNAFFQVCFNTKPLMIAGITKWHKPVRNNAYTWRQAQNAHTYTVSCQNFVWGQKASEHHVHYRSLSHK